MSTILLIDLLAEERSAIGELLSEAGFTVQRVTGAAEVPVALTQPGLDLAVVRATTAVAVALFEEQRQPLAASGLPLLLISTDEPQRRKKSVAQRLGTAQVVSERIGSTGLLNMVSSLLPQTQQSRQQPGFDELLSRLLELLRGSAQGVSERASQLLSWATTASQLPIGSLWLLEQDELVCLAWSEDGQPREEQLRVPLAEADHFRRALASSAPGYGVVAHGENGILSRMGWAINIPLVVHTEPIGLLVLGSRSVQEPAPEALVRMLRLADLAPILGVSLQNARLLADSQDQRRIISDFEQAKDDFLSLVSHELKNPLAAIKGYTELLRRRSRRDPQLVERFKGVEMIEQQVTRMGQLLDMLLDASRLASSRFSVEPQPGVDLVELIEREVVELQAASDRHQFLLTCEEPVIEAELDSARISQLINQLLSNARKFSPEGGTIRVSIQREGDWALLSVSDDGVGIPADEVDLIFERFARASNAVSGFSGLGVGLYIAREIVTRHGGSIEVTSAEGQGATFGVRLPVATRSVHRSEQASSPASETL